MTQSGGSRYESGRNMPRPVQALLRLVHVEQIDVSKIRRDDYEVIEYLRAKEPDLLQATEEGCARLEQEGGLSACINGGYGLTRTVSPSSP
ncbi:MAG: hypothetical protein MZW92_74070 [Comamonadaceae bacterium]|nr:hypothetical protein [Comamonadaceae bacterium]